MKISGEARFDTVKGQMVLDGAVHIQPDTPEQHEMLTRVDTGDDSSFVDGELVLELHIPVKPQMAPVAPPTPAGPTAPTAPPESSAT